MPLPRSVILSRTAPVLAALGLGGMGGLCACGSSGEGSLPDAAADAPPGDATMHADAGDAPDAVFANDAGPDAGPTTPLLDGAPDAVAPADALASTDAALDAASPDAMPDATVPPSEGGAGDAEASADVADAVMPASACLLAFGDTTRQRPGGIASDRSGDMLISGAFDGTIDFGDRAMTRTAGSGSSDVYLAKFDSACHPIFSKQYGDGAEQYGGAIATDRTGNIVLSGSFFSQIDFGGGPLTTSQNNVYLAKLDPSGKHLWSHAYGAPTTTIYGGGLAVDGAGAIALSGQLVDRASATFGTTTLTGAGGIDVWVAKIDASGTPLWAKRYGDAADQRGAVVAADPSGNVILAGYFQGTMDFGGATLTATKVGLNAGADVYVAKLGAADGAYAWARRFGDENDQYCDAVAVDPSGNVWLAGHFDGSIDFGLASGPLTASHGQTILFLAKLDATDGHTLWAESFWGGSYQLPTALTADASGNVFMAGAFQGALTFGPPLTQADDEAPFVTKFDTHGTALWSAGGGAATFDVPSGVAVDPAGHALLTGSLEGTLPLAGSSVKSAGSADLFLAKLPLY